MDKNTYNNLSININDNNHFYSFISKLDMIKYQFEDI